MAARGTFFEDRDRGWKALLQIAKVGAVGSEFGVFGAGRHPTNGVVYAALATYHEYGGKNGLPQRPFIRNTMSKYDGHNKLVALLGQAIDGLWAPGQITNAIHELAKRFAKHARDDLRLGGLNLTPTLSGTAPLIDTGTLASKIKARRMGQRRVRKAAAS